MQMWIVDNNIMLGRESGKPKYLYILFAFSRWALAVSGKSMCKTQIDSRRDQQRAGHSPHHES